MSHELRTPLTLTIGPLEDLRARAGGDPQVERWLDIALRNARRLLRLVNQILDVAKLEAGAMHLAPRPLDLAPFTRGVVAAFAPVAERKGIRLTVETSDALPGAFDADAVEKILTNLLSNAIKFTPSGGTVHVALSTRWRVGAARRAGLRARHPARPARARLRAILPGGRVDHPHAAGHGHRALAGEGARGAARRDDRGGERECRDDVHGDHSVARGADGVAVADAVDAPDAARSLQR